MNVEEAKKRLEIAEYQKGSCERHLNHASRDWIEAKAADGSNDIHYRLRRIHGDDYRKLRKEAWEYARKEFDRACKEEKKLREEYEKAVEDCRQ